MTYLSSIILFVTLLSSASAGIGCSWNNKYTTCNVAFYTCSDYTTWNTCAKGEAETQNACEALSTNCTWSVSLALCTNNINRANPKINDCEYGACYAQMICSGADDDDNTTSQSICDSRDAAVTPEDGIYGAWKQMECGQVGVATWVWSNSGSRIGGSALLVILVTFLTTVASLKLV